MSEEQSEPTLENWRDKVWKSEVLRSRERIKELEGLLETWKSAFGSSQLTHAVARLEAAEDKAKRLEAKVEKHGKIMLGRAGGTIPSSDDCVIISLSDYERIGKLESLLSEAVVALKEALSDDEYNDHSSGIWQLKAKRVLAKIEGGGK